MEIEEPANIDPRLSVFIFFVLLSPFPLRGLELMYSHSLSRREILRAGIVGVGWPGLGGFARAAVEAFPPVRVITRGPKFHWFGYYDKLEFDPTNRYVLGMEVDFEHRTPQPTDLFASAWSI